MTDRLHQFKVDEWVDIPIGVAHGFLALEPLQLIYLVTNEYDGSDELGFAWDDPRARQRRPRRLSSRHLSARNQPRVEHRLHRDRPCLLAHRWRAPSRDRWRARSAARQRDQRHRAIAVRDARYRAGGVHSRRGVTDPNCGTARHS